MKDWIIIFDMDGTLYDLNDVVQMSYDMQVKYLCKKKGMAENEVKAFLEKNHIYPVMKKDSKSATELFLSIGIDKNEWAEYRNNCFDINKISTKKAVKMEVIKRFSEEYEILLLSSNSFENLKKVLNHINIPISLFNEVICSDRFPYKEPFKKTRAIQYWKEKYKVAFETMISIGDRYATDIEPMLHLGGKGILIHQPSSLERIFNDLVSDKVLSCGEYTYYTTSL